MCSEATIAAASAKPKLVSRPTFFVPYFYASGIIVFSQYRQHRAVGERKHESDGPVTRRVEEPVAGEGGQAADGDDGEPWRR